MRLLLIFLALCSGSVLTVLLTKRRAEEAVPFSITVIIVALFLFYINDQLNIGYFFLLSIVGLVYLYAISFILYHYIKNKNSNALANIVKRILTPGMLVFFLLFVILYAITRSNIVCDWDELRLWAAYPKALYYTNQLQLGTSSLIYTIMQPYPPGMALFQYFVQRLSGSFQEANLFWEYGIIAISVFLPAIRQTNWKDLWWILVSAFLIFATPLFFSNSGFDNLLMYRSLFIDPILGLLFAYCLFIGFQDEISDVFTSARLGLGLGALTLMKDSGVTLAVIAFVIILVTNRTKLRKTGRNVTFQRFCLLLIGIIFIFGCYGLWRFTLKQYGVESFYHFDKKNLALDLNFTKEFIEGFYKISILKTPMFDRSISSVSFSIVFAEAICLLFAIVITRLNREQERKRIYRLLIGLFIGNILFFIGIYFTFLGVYDKNMLSFERYSCTILQANIALLVCLLFNTGTAQIAAAYNAKSILKLGLAMIVICSIVIFPLNIKPKRSTVAAESQVHADIIRDSVLQSGGTRDSEKKSVYCAFQAESVDLRHHRIYFDLLSENIFVELYSISLPTKKIPVYCTDPTQENIAQMKKDFLNALTASHCSYVYFVDDIPQTQEQMPEFFSQGSMKGDMYEAVFSDAGEIIAFQHIPTDTESLAHVKENK